MAEFAAHLALVPTGDKPSFFEVLAQDNLNIILRSSAQYVCKIMAQNYPSKYIWLYKYSDELYLFFDCIIQHYHLQKYGGSFSENFYNLKRILSRISNIIPGWKLPLKVHFKSLICLVLIPYIKLKLDYFFERIRLKIADNLCDEKKAINIFYKFFVLIYPVFHMLWETTHLFYQLAYVCDKSSIHSPFLKMCGVQLALMTKEDLFQQNIKTLSQGISLSGTLKYGFGVLAKSLTHMLAVGVFFLQFVDWWYASDYKTTTSLLLPIPPPPKIIYENAKVPDDPSICPICFKTRTNDTALATSGYVFCYPCIYNYLQKYERCPVTNLSSSLTQLIKLYFDDF